MVEADTSGKTSIELVRIAIDANVKLQTALTEKALKLEAHLEEIDRLLEAQEVEDEPESEIAILGSKRAVGLFPASEFLNPLSPFYDDASRRNTYIMNTRSHPMKEKDLEVLADAVKKENERLQALRRIHMSASATEIEPDSALDTINNIEGLDWGRIAERVSDASSVKRNATDCRVTWIANRPCVNRAPWTSAELEQLDSVISAYPPDKVNWVEVADKLGTNRIPIDCMRQEIHHQRHYWTPDADQRLTKAVETYGIGNWHLVARKVDEYVTPPQCQARWCKRLDPSLRHGAWTEEEDNRLRKAVAGYGTSWIQVASAVPGRTNDQCRERWTEHLNIGPQQSWTEEEDKILIAAVAQFGGKWKEISSKVGNNKTGPACRRRYDKLKKPQRTQATSPATSSMSGPMSSTTQTSIMSISQESTQTLLPVDTGDAGSAQSTPNVVPAAVSVPKPRPRPRPRQKGTAVEGSCVGESVEAPNSTIATPASSAALSESAIQVVSQLKPGNNTPKSPGTSVSIAPEQHLPGPSVDSALESTRTDALTSKGKRKAVGKSDADSSSKKTRRTRSQAKATTTEHQAGDDTATESATAGVADKSNREAFVPRRGRSAGKIDTTNIGR